jgi:hypothetical protein
MLIIWRKKVNEVTTNPNPFLARFVQALTLLELNHALDFKPTTATRDTIDQGSFPVTATIGGVEINWLCYLHVVPDDNWTIKVSGGGLDQQERIGCVRIDSDLLARVLGDFLAEFEELQSRKSIAAVKAAAKEAAASDNGENVVVPIKTAGH